MPVNKVRMIVVAEPRAATALINTGVPVEILGCAESVAEAFAAAQKHGPGVLVVDLRRAGGRERDVPVAHHRLSPQERRIMEQVAKGRTNKEVGRILNLSFRTVKNYLSNAYQKLHVSGRLRAVEVFKRQRAYRF